MTEAERLHKEAERCRRLAHDLVDDQAHQALLQLAAEYDERAALAEQAEKRAKNH